MCFTLVCVCVCVKVFPKLGRFLQNNYMDNLSVEKIPREILLFTRAKTKFCTWGKNKREVTDDGKSL